MNENNIQDFFIKALLEKIPKKTKLADFVAQTLCMEKETAYRRLRGEVPFSFREVALLAGNLNISLDEFLIQTGTHIRKKMIMTLPEKYMTEVYDESQIYEMIGHLETFAGEQGSEYGAALSGIPFSLFLQYSLLSRFFRLKYINHAENVLANTPFEKIWETEAKIKHKNHLYLLYRQISHTYYIWDRKIIPLLVDDINYARSIRLLQEPDVKELKEELLRFLRDLENQAATGRFSETGNKFELYISDAHIDITYSYVCSSQKQMSMLSSFIFFDTVSEDKMPFMKISNWIKSLKRFSTLVSGIGERERILFFEEQRAIVSTL